MSNKEVLDYFSRKAEKYDLVDSQIYWQLSDKLLWYCFGKFALPEDKKSYFTFFDAGGGTGRWSFKILEEYENSTGVLYDVSEDMLHQARTKLSNSNFQDRLQIIQGDLHNINIAENFFDLSFNFHNVLGFVEKPKVVLESLSRLIKTGGRIVSFIPNLYHGLFFGISQGDFESVDSLSRLSMGRFTKDMPFMHFFTPESISELYNDLSLDIELLTGFPMLIYPSFQETQLTGNSKGILDILSNKFEEIFNIESSFVGVGDHASRGNNLFIMGRKSL